MLTKCLVVLLLCSVSSFAQIPEAPKPQKLVTWDFLAAESVNWGGTLADGAVSVHCVSRRSPEGNPMFAAPNGGFKAGKYFAINGAIAAGFTLVHVLVRKYDKSKTSRVLTDLASSGNGIPHIVQAIKWREYCR